MGLRLPSSKSLLKMPKKKKEDKQLFCFKELLKIDKKELESKVFEIISSDHHRHHATDTQFKDDEDSDEYDSSDESKKYLKGKFVMVRKKVYSKYGVIKILLTVVDVSKNLLYDKLSAKNEFLQLINATVSHEMRNPLNSILN
mmetsp:Transcript_29360/g.44309  ORF Transcript_29360/g.44309 Transcript_29360/m.44309 type:complete len:143 (-) Transcript_29360:1784-2212(-)